MAIHYAEQLRQHSELFELAKLATKQLEEDVGPSLDSAKTLWDFEADERGRGFAKLELSDWAGAVTARFNSKDLESPLYLSLRLVRLWGDLLQIRSHKQLEELRSS